MNAAICPSAASWIPAWKLPVPSVRPFVRLVVAPSFVRLLPVSAWMCVEVAVTRVHEPLPLTSYSSAKSPDPATASVFWIRMRSWNCQSPVSVLVV